MAQPVSVLRGDDLRRKREASLGDTLSRELGVASSSFGPGAGRPIIRGLDGPRIRVLENGIGTLDLSTISLDHAVTVESFNASQNRDTARSGNTALWQRRIGRGSQCRKWPDPQPTVQISKRGYRIRGNTATAERSGALNAAGSVRKVSWSVGVQAQDRRLPYSRASK